MGRRCDENKSKQRNETVNRTLLGDDFIKRCCDIKRTDEDIKIFMNKLETLEDKLNHVSEILHPIHISSSYRSIDRGSPKEEARILIDKVRLLEEKVDRFSKLIAPDNSSDDDHDRKSSNRAFKLLIDKLRSLEEKLREFSMVTTFHRPTEERRGIKVERAQIVKKLQLMEEQIDRFSQLIPNRVESHILDETDEDSRDVMIEKMQELAESINFHTKMAASKSHKPAYSPAKKPKVQLPKALFSGELTRKKKETVKKGFITWPSEDETAEMGNDRYSYIMSCGESQTNSKWDNLFSEPSEFYLDASLRSQTNGQSIKESKAWGTAKVKNSELEGCKRQRVEQKMKEDGWIV